MLHSVVPCIVHRTRLRLPNSLLPSPRVAKLSTVISFSRRVYRVRVAQFSIHDTSKCFFYLYKYKVKPRIVRRKIARQKMQLAQTYDNPFS